MAFDRNANGYEITSQDYFYDLGEALSKNFSSASRSSICEARQKLSWKAFEYILNELQITSLQNDFKWLGHAVRAIDGTKITLPKSDKILAEFPQRKVGGQGNADSKEVSHYPFALLVTACDVFTGQPLAAQLENMHGSERKSAISMIGDFNKGDITLLDRGLDGIQVWKAVEDHGQFYVSRLREIGKNGGAHFQYVHQFISSNKLEQIIERKTKNPETREEGYLKIRLIRGRKLKDGSVLVIGTNLLDAKKYPAQALLELYSHRWKVETMYARVKTLLNLEQFHSRSPNGIRQEIFANLIVSSMAAILSTQAICTNNKNLDAKNMVPNLKNAVQIIKRNLFYYLGQIQLSARQHYHKAKLILHQTLQSLCKKQPDRSYPRYSRQPVNRWPFAKTSKIKLFHQGRRTNESEGIRTKHVVKMS